MKSKIIFPIVLLAVSFYAFTNYTVSDEKEPWSESQLIEPATLAKIMNDTEAKQPIIYSVGPVGDIKGCVDIGAAQDKENLGKLKVALSKLPKGRRYCYFLWMLSF